MAIDTPEQLEAARAEMAAGSAAKADADKPRWSLMPMAALAEVARVYTFGARKYADHNWRRGMAWSRMLDAAYRHLDAFNGGEDRDPDSGLHHLAHATFCLLAVIWYGLTGRGEDDRYVDSDTRPLNPERGKLFGIFDQVEMPDGSIELRLEDGTVAGKMTLESSQPLTVKPEGGLAPPAAD